MSVKQKSYIWEFFERNELENQFATCLLCKKEYRTSGNTSNLRDHLNRFHKSALRKRTDENTDSESDTDNSDLGPKFKKPKQQKLSFIEKPSRLYLKNDARKLKLDRLFAFMIATDCQPYFVASDAGFLNFVHALDPKYEIPSRITLSKKILPMLFSEITTKLVKIFSAVNYVSLTTDMWSSIAGQGYITVTAHFIFKNALKSAVLEAVQLEGRHTAEAIRDHLQNIIEVEWKLNNKISWIISDNAANMLKASELLRLTHLPCFAHTLNLTVTDGLEGKTRSEGALENGVESEEEKLKSLLQKCRNIVRFFKKSTLAMDRLANEQQKKNKTPLKPVQDVVTRWNSTLYMLERLLELHEDDCLTIALSNSTNAPDILNLTDISNIKEIVLVLKPFEEATNKISGDSYVTLSLIIPIVVGIQTSLQNVGKTLKNNTAKNLHSKLIAIVQKRLFPYETRTLPQVATLLDPRLKKFAFRNPDNATHAQLFVQKELTKLMQKSLEPISFDGKQNNENKLVEPAPSTSKEVKSNNYSGSLFSFLSQRISETDRMSTFTTDSIILVRQYLETKVLPINSNLIEYWTTQTQFPSAFAELAKKILSIPATSVSSERVFSKAGQIISDRRSNLKPKNVNILIFVGQNKWLHED